MAIPRGSNHFEGSDWKHIIWPLCVTCRNAAFENSDERIICKVWVLKSMGPRTFMLVQFHKHKVLHELFVLNRFENSTDYLGPIQRLTMNEFRPSLSTCNFTPICSHTDGSVSCLLNFDHMKSLCLLLYRKENEFCFRQLFVWRVKSNKNPYPYPPIRRIFTFLAAVLQLRFTIYCERIKGILTLLAYF